MKRLIFENIIGRYHNYIVGVTTPAESASASASDKEI